MEADEKLSNISFKISIGVAVYPDIKMFDYCLGNFYFENGTLT
jgi:hypothetical protein